MKARLFTTGLAALALAAHAQAGLLVRELWDGVGTEGTALEGAGDGSSSLGFASGSTWIANPAGNTYLLLSDAFDLTSTYQGADPDTLPGPAANAGAKGGIFCPDAGNNWDTGSWALRELASPISFTADGTYYFSVRLDNAGDSCLGIGFASGGDSTANFIGAGFMWNNYWNDQAYHNAVYISAGTVGGADNPTVGKAHGPTAGIDGIAVLVGKLTTRASGTATLAVKVYKPGTALDLLPDSIAWDATYDASNVASATHLLIWANGAGQAALDAIRVGTSYSDAGGVYATAPVAAPANTVYAGTPVTLTVAAGVGPMTVQWRKNGADLEGATSIPLVIANPVVGDSGSYDVVIKNDAGTATSPALTLTVQPANPPVFPTAPASATRLLRGSVSFTAVVDGTPPITLKWQHNDTDIPGATTATLKLENLKTSDAGAYKLIAENSFGTKAVTADLQVVTPTAGSYADLVATNGLVAYWQLDETGDATGGTLVAHDVWAGLDGTYGVASVVGLAGPRPASFPGFAAGNNAVQTTTDNATNSWATVPALNLNTNAVTFAAWVYPNQSQLDYTGLFMTRSGGTEAGIGYTSGNQLGYTWNGNSTWSYMSGLVIPEAQWSFVAVVIEPTRATLYLGTDGVLTNAVNAIAHTSEAWGGAALIGDDQANFTRAFDGLMDEVAVYRRSLSFDEINRLYGAGLGIVQVVAPTLASQPVSQQLYAGRTVKFQAIANGSAPLKYQWKKGGSDVIDGGAISGATTDTLTIAGIAAADAGSYTLTVSNSGGSATTDPATLAVTPLPAAGSYAAAVLSHHPLAFWRLNDTGDPTEGASAFDFWGGFTGTYGTAAENGKSSVAGPRPADGFTIFESANAAARFANGVDQSWVQVPALNLNSGTVTFALWVHPDGSQIDWSGLLMTRSGTSAGVGYTSGNQLGYTWNNDSTWSYNSGLIIPQDQWSFVAVSIEATKSTLYLYNAQGKATATNAVAHTSEVWGGVAQIGNDTNTGNGGRTFTGSIDEVAVFPRALSTAEIDDLYAGKAAVTEVKLELSRTGADLQLKWAQGTLLEADTVNGSWKAVDNAVSPFIVTPSVGNKFYKVQVQ